MAARIALCVVLVVLLVTSVAWGLDNNCLVFDNSAVLLPNAVLEGMTDWTFEFWVKRNDVFGDERVFTGCLANAQGLTFFQMNDLGQLGVLINGNGFSLMQDIYYEPDTWVHFALVVSGNDVAIYKNGAELHTTSVPDAAIVIDGMVLGQYTSGWLGPDDQDVSFWDETYALQGALDEIRIWATARTPQEIADNYQVSVSPDHPDLRAYYNFNDITDFLVPDMTGSPLVGLMGASPGPDPYDPQIILSDAPFTDNNLGGGDPDPLPEFSCLYFDEDAAFFPSALLDGRQNWTVECWVDLNNYDEEVTLFSASSAGGTETDYHGFHEFFEGGGTEAVGFSYAGAGTAGGNGMWRETRWQHLAFTCDDTEVLMYLDGQLLHGMNNPGPLPDSDVLAIGAQLLDVLGNDDPGDAPTFSNHLIGCIDELRIWTSTRTEQEINDNMNSSLTLPVADLLAYYPMNEGEGQVIADVTGNGYDGWLGLDDDAEDDRDPTWQISTCPLEYGGSADKAMYFSFATWNVPSALLDGLTDYTIEMWVLPFFDPTDTGNEDMWLLHGTTDLTGTLGLRMALDPNGFVAVDMNDEDMSGSEWEQGKWGHFAVSVLANGADGEYTIYWNGVAIGASNGDIFSDLVGLTFGGRGYEWTAEDTPSDPGTDWPNRFIGLMDEVRVWSEWRQDDEIAATMYQTVDPSSPNLVAYYNFNDGTDQTVEDITGNGWDGWLGPTMDEEQTLPGFIEPSFFQSFGPFVDLSGPSGPALEVDITGHDFGMLNIWEDAELTVGYSNTGSETLTISDVTLGNAQNYTIDGTVTHVLEPGESAEFTVILDPVDTGDVDAFLRFFSDDAANPQIDILLEADVIDPPPEGELDFTVLDFGDQVLNGAYTWDVCITNIGGQTLTLDDVSIDPDDVFLVYPEIYEAGHGEFVRFKVTFLPPEDAPDDFTATLTVQTNASNMLSVDIPVSGSGVYANPEWSIGAGWTMLSIPYYLGPGVTFGEMFSDDLIGTDWMIAGFDLPEGWFWADEDTELNIFKGYWLMASGVAGDAFTLDVQDGQAFGTTGMPIPLDFDWNLISLPIGWGCDLTECTFFKEGAYESYAMALQLGWIYPWTYHLSALNGNWISEGESYVIGTELEPFHGYWFRTATEDLYLIPPGSQDVTPDPDPDPVAMAVETPWPGDGWDDLNAWSEGENGSSTIGAIDDLDEAAGWTLGFAITGGSMVYSLPVIGLHDDATDGFDLMHDAPRGPDGPNGSSAITAGFMHPEWQQGQARFVRDVHAMLETGESTQWTMTVTSTPGTPLVLHWPDYATDVPAGYEVVLTNEDNGDSFQAHVLPEYVFTCDGLTEFTIDVIASVTAVDEPASATALPTEYAVSNAYPNPFNPSVSVELALPDPARLTVVVYDILGRQVATLVDEQRQAGYHTISWHAGHHAAGVYFVRMHANSHHDVRKVMLLK